MPTLLLRRLVHWIACAAILLNTLAPTLSQALSATDEADAIWRSSICSVQALNPAAASPADGSGRQSARHAGVCPYCGFQFWALTGALDGAPDFSLRGPHFSMRQEPARQIKLLDPWPRAHARAPPAATSSDGA